MFVRYQTTIPFTKGRLPEACREVERVRFPRADLHSAPGRLRAKTPGRHYDRSARCSLHCDGRERVTPAPHEFCPRKRVTGVEQRRSLAAAIAAVERRQASAPEALVRGNT